MDEGRDEQMAPSAGPKNAEIGLYSLYLRISAPTRHVIGPRTGARTRRTKDNRSICTGKQV